MNDLDWLARNVHHWHEDSARLGVVGRENGYPDPRFPLSTDADYGFTREQWLTRRAELQNKPSWDLSSSWAQHLAQDQDGEWKWLGGNVLPCADCWTADELRVQCKGIVLGEWRDTLEKRPDMHKNHEKIHTSAEHVQKAEESMHIEQFVSAGDANPKFPRDVDYVGKINAAIAKQQSPKGRGSPILGMVLADLTNRALEGKEKYGEPLLAHNGRNPLWDAYQEALDLAMYLRQAIEEQK